MISNDYVMRTTHGEMARIIFGLTGFRNQGMYLHACDRTDYAKVIKRSKLKI